MTSARICQHCGEPFPPHKGCNRYCLPCGPVAAKATKALYRLEHKEATRARGIAYRANRTRPKPAGRLLRCWCGNLFVPHTGRHKHCTNDCARRAWRIKHRQSRPVVVAPAPTLPPVDYDSILTEIMQTARRARLKIQADQELVGTSAYKEKQERLGRVLSAMANPFAVP